jgi:hypothetical protein
MSTGNAEDERHTDSELAVQRRTTNVPGHKAVEFPEEKPTSRCHESDVEPLNAA